MSISSRQEAIVAAAKHVQVYEIVDQLLDGKGTFATLEVAALVKPEGLSDEDWKEITADGEMQACVSVAVGKKASDFLRKVSKQFGKENHTTVSKETMMVNSTGGLFRVDEGSDSPIDKE